MYREEFILKLRKELSKLPPEEIVEATEYFEEIFAEATEGLGEEERLAEEKRLVEEFGNPKKIAAQVKADYAARLLDGDESVIDGKPGAKKKLSAVWWVIIGIVSAPVSIPLAICAFWVLFGAACVVVGLAVGIIGSAVAGLGCVVFGAVSMADAVSSGIMVTGIGLIVLAASVAAGAGLFIGVRAAVIAIAKAIRRGREKHRIRKLEEAFIREMEADAAEAEAAIEIEPEADQMLLTGGEGNE